MTQSDNLFSIPQLPSLDSTPLVKDSSDKKKKKKAVKQKGLTADTNMRNAFIRVSAVNHITEDNPKLGLKAGDIYTISLDDIKETLEKWAHTKKTMKYYFIMHDADPNNVHYHIVLDFDKNSVGKFSLIKKHFPYGKIEPAKSVKASVQYLIHMNHPYKKQYSEKNIYTNNKDKLYSYLVMTAYGVNVRGKFVLDQIISGKLKEHDIGKIDPWVYMRYKRKINDAFEYVKKCEVAVQERDITIMVIQGPARVGKTLFAKAYAKKHNMSICFSAASRDPWEGYGGQDIFVLDDFDPSGMNVNDFKKLLDPHTNTLTSKRFTGALFRGSIIFIITNTPIVEWFPEDTEENREPVMERILRVFDFQDFKLKFCVDVKRLTEAQISEEYAKFQRQSKLVDGVARYTVNKIVSFSDIAEEYRSYAENHFVNYAGRFLLSVEKGELLGVDCYHEFDLNKYVDLGADERRAQKLVDEMLLL